MFFKAEFVPLAGKYAAGLIIHPVIEILVWLGENGGKVQIVPVALVLEQGGKVFVSYLERAKNPVEFAG